MRNVHFIPKQAAVALKKPSRVIAISSRYDSFLTYGADHKQLLRLSFDPSNIRPQPGMQDYRITEDQCHQIIDFLIVAMQHDEDIIVHCGEGRIRSPAVAQALEYIANSINDNCLYSMSLEHPDCIGSDAMMDRDLYFKIRSVYEQDPDDALRQIAKKHIDAGREVIGIERQAAMVKYVPTNLSADRYPGYAFIPGGGEGYEELTFEERLELYSPGHPQPISELERGDLYCAIENNRTPTHRIIEKDKEA